MIGETIAHYRVTAKLGAGGMGEVYRATDTKLGRDVALKVLPREFSADPQRMVRFQREAHVLASLNHTNIAAIYGLEEAKGTTGSQPVPSDAQAKSLGHFALVLELVDGPTLTERIAQGALPLDEALPIAKQIAEALEYAHERGIIHRDLKPANVKITPEGNVKVLDFGLAKALQDDSAAADMTSSPTLSAAATKAGIILGTAAYMSPEQARGKPADKRADIWSFGVVLYEMLTGRQAYGGETASDAMAAIITKEPDWGALPAETPTNLRRLLQRMLTKDPRQRLRDIGEARIEMERPSDVEAVLDSARTLPVAAQYRPGRILTVMMVVAALAAGAAITWLLKPGPIPASVVRVAETVPSEHVIAARNRGLLAISPDGTKLVYVANRRLYLRALHAPAAVEVAGTEGAWAPFFSPDGEWIGFFVAAQTKKVPVSGGAPVPICACDGTSASWGPNGTILIGARLSGILRVSAQGGTPTVVIAPRQGMSFDKPKFLPDGKTFLYVRGLAGSADTREAVIRSLDGNDEGTVVLRGLTEGKYISTGHLLFAKEADLTAVPFDLASRRVTGSPATVAQVVDFATAGDVSHFAVSDTGTLVYLTYLGAEGTKTRLAAVDHAGKTSVLPLDARVYSDPRVSPDGRSLALHLQDSQDDVWVADVSRGTLTRLSFDPGEDETPIWSPDGRTIAWAATRGSLDRGIFRRAADGSGKEELVWKLDKHAHLRDWLPDGKGLLVEIQDPVTGTDIWRLDLAEKPTPTVFLQTPFSERNSRLSPDGRWIAYVSDESGRDEIYVQSFPTPGARVQVSTNGGDQPVWSRNGRSLFFRGEKAIQEASFEPGARPTVGKVRALFLDRFESPQVGGHTGYDVFPDGHLLMIQSFDPQQGGGAMRFDIVFVFNWFQELKRVAPAGK